MNDAVKVELPGDRLYSDDCYVTTFSLADASALSLLPKTQDTRTIFEIMDRRINLDVKKLTLQDFWFLLYWQRINSYLTFPIKLPWKCPHCKTKNQDELTASKLVITDLDEAYGADEHGHGIILDLPSAGELEVRMKLVGDELDANTYLRKKKIDNPNPELYEQLLIACSLEGNGGSLEERLELVKGLSAEDYYLIKSLDSEIFDYGVQDYADLTCMGCKEVSKVRYSFDLTTFFPSVSDKPDLRARILPRKGASTANKGSTGHGSSKDNVHKQDSHQLHQDVKADERPEKSGDESQEKIEITPNELQAMIQKEVAKVGMVQTDHEIDFDSLKEK